MCVGEKRRITIASELGYGEAGSPPKISGGATLRFDVELLEVKAPPKKRKGKKKKKKKRAPKKDEL